MGATAPTSATLGACHKLRPPKHTLPAMGVDGVLYGARRFALNSLTVVAPSQKRGPRRPTRATLKTRQPELRSLNFSMPLSRVRGTAPARNAAKQCHTHPLTKPGTDASMRPARPRRQVEASTSRSSDRSHSPAWARKCDKFAPARRAEPSGITQLLHSDARNDLSWESPSIACGYAQTRRRQPHANSEKRPRDVQQFGAEARRAGARGCSGSLGVSKRAVSLPPVTRAGSHRHSPCAVGAGDGADK